MVNIFGGEEDVLDLSENPRTHPVLHTLGEAVAQSAW